MFDSIWKDVKKEFSYGNMVTRIIFVNIGVFLFVYLVKLILRIVHGGDPSFEPAFENFSNFLSISGNLFFDLTHPWVFFTHMFLHFGFFHILWNMLFLYWFGRIVGDFIGNQRVLPLYLLGGLAGAGAYLIFANVAYGGEGFAYGASGAVNAIVVAAAVISPDYMIRLLFFGDVKLKFIAAIVVLFSLMGVADLNNTGGDIAHLGGALFGYIYVSQASNKPLNLFGWLTTFLTKRKNPLKTVYKSSKRKSNTSKESLGNQLKIDEILDKISKSGYDTLTKKEKEFLFKQGK